MVLLNLSNIYISAGKFFVIVGTPIHHRIFSSLPGFCSQDASSACSETTKNLPPLPPRRKLPGVPSGANLLSLESCYASFKNFVRKKWDKGFGDTL